jgi:DNA processing protein
MGDRAELMPVDVGRRGVPRSADPVAALALSFVDDVGPVTYRAWATADGGADRAFRSRVGGSQQARASHAASDALRRAASSGATLLLVGDDAYPGALLELGDPPPALWCLGSLALLDEARPRVAIVGTRSATGYGLRAAASLASQAAASGVVVVSGMARGIDAAAHVAALEAGGDTIAVLGSGVDVPYPRAHHALHRRIVAHGLVLSELPPGARPTAGAFPRRNRVVAALSRATVVVEAGVKSGALITAGLALDLGRDVAAVPGPIDTPQAGGTNALLRDGAAVITDAADLLDLVGVPRACEGIARRSAAAPTELGGDELLVWTALADAAPDLDVLSGRTGLGPRACAAAIGLLEAGGHVQTGFDGSIARR